MPRILIAFKFRRFRALASRIRQGLRNTSVITEYYMDMRERR